MTNAGISKLSPATLESLASSVPTSHSRLGRLLLWPNLLSLDAVAVAVIWQQLFAASAKITLALNERCALAVAVWIIYVWDRALDGFSGSVQRSSRHIFYRRIRRAALASGALAFCAEVLICTELSRIVVADGVILASVVSLYFLCVHSANPVRTSLPKELVVATLFAAGTALVPFAQASHDWKLVIPFILFGALCFLNCMAIEYGESRHYGHGFPARCGKAFSWPARHVTSTSFSLAFVSAVIGCFSPEPLLYIAIVVASFGLVWFDCIQKSLSPDQLRIFADLPLVLPVLILLAAHVHGL